MRIEPKKQDQLEGDLTPMIDMVFQLIAFFMMLVNFSQADQQVEIKLPDSELAKPTDDRPKHPVVLNLRREGDVVIGGEPTQIAGLGIYLDQEKQDAKRKGLEPAEITIIIRAHELAKTGDVQKLISKCQENNLETFALRVKERVD